MRNLILALSMLVAAVGALAQPSLEPGWPSPTGFAVSQSATAANIDDDDYLEVVIASQDGFLYVFNHDGTFSQWWPQYMGPALGADPYANICSSPAAYDLNDDGLIEIIVGCFDGYMYVFEATGNLFPGWPFQSGYMIFSTPAIGDIDDDGEMEIVYGDNSGGIYALNSDATVCPGFPYMTPYVVRSSPALGDLDADGVPEIVITADNNDYHLYAIDGDGTDLPGFPIQFADAIGSNSSPTLADVDADGDLEIVVGDRSGYLHVLHHDGQYLPNWPIDAGYSLQSCPTVVNLDNDPEMKIIVGMNDSQVIIYELDGSYFPGWPQPTAYTVISSPSVGDIDGDGELEIVVGCNNGYVYGWNLDGSTAEGFPLTNPYYTVYSSPLLEDLDYDGHLEMVLGSNDTWVYCWDMGPDTYNPNLLPWPQFRLNAQNTACVTAAPNVDIVLTPSTLPIIIPASGGSFDFTVEIINQESVQHVFDAWIMVTLPNGSPYGPVLGPVNLTLSGGASISRDRTQMVPASAPSGTYLYNAYTGQYPDVIWDHDFFEFSKSAAESGGSLIGEWSNTGEPFEGEQNISKVTQPAAFQLHPCSPNPFNPTTTLSFTLPEASNVNLAVFDVSGRQVATLVDGSREAGTHEITFDGSALASGVYIYRLTAGEYDARGKMVLMK